MNTTPIPEKDLRRAFIVSLILKGLNSVFELIGGVLLLFTGAVTGFITLLISA